MRRGEVDDGTYDPYNKAGGPNCGLGLSGGEVYCKPGDACARPGTANGSFGQCS